MPYTVKGKCIYKKDTGKKVGCTKGDVQKYLAALHMHAEGLNESSIENRLQNTLGYFLSFNGRPSKNGMKLSIQGKTLEDAVELYNLVGPYLQQNNVAFKLGTPRLIAKNDPIQSKKLLTIYVPDDVEFNKFAEDIYRKIKKYKGWYNIKTPPKYQHYAGGIFYRNDRDEFGNYIPANRNETYTGKNMKLREDRGSWKTGGKDILDKMNLIFAENKEKLEPAGPVTLHSKKSKNGSIDISLWTIYNKDTHEFAGFNVPMGKRIGFSVALRYVNDRNEWQILKIVDGGNLLKSKYSVSSNIKADSILNLINDYFSAIDTSQPAGFKENRMKLKEIFNNLIIEGEAKIAKGNKSTKNSFGDEKIETPWATGKKDDCCKDYGITYEEAEKKLRAIKSIDNLDEEYQNLTMQMTNSFDRNRFRICYSEIRKKIGQKEYPEPTMTNKNTIKESTVGEKVTVKNLDWINHTRLSKWIFYHIPEDAYSIKTKTIPSMNTNSKYDPNTYELDIFVKNQQYYNDLLNYLQSQSYSIEK